MDSKSRECQFQSVIMGAEQQMSGCGKRSFFGRAMPKFPTKNYTHVMPTAPKSHCAFLDGCVMRNIRQSNSVFKIRRAESTLGINQPGKCVVNDVIKKSSDIDYKASRSDCFCRLANDGPKILLSL